MPVNGRHHDLLEAESAARVRGDQMRVDSLAAQSRAVQASLDGEAAQARREQLEFDNQVMQATYERSLEIYRRTHT